MHDLCGHMRFCFHVGSVMGFRYGQCLRSHLRLAIKPFCLQCWCFFTPIWRRHFPGAITPPAPPLVQAAVALCSAPSAQRLLRYHVVHLVSRELGAVATKRKGNCQPLSGMLPFRYSPPITDRTSTVFWTLFGCLPPHLAIGCFGESLLPCARRQAPPPNAAHPPAPSAVLPPATAPCRWWQEHLLPPPPECDPLRTAPGPHRIVQRQVCKVREGPHEDGVACAGPFAVVDVELEGLPCCGVHVEVHGVAQPLRVFAHGHGVAVVGLGREAEDATQRGLCKGGIGVCQR